jgi:hypothetical protein
MRSLLNATASRIEQRCAVPSWTCFHRPRSRRPPSRIARPAGPRRTGIGVTLSRAEGGLRRHATRRRERPLIRARRDWGSGVLRVPRRAGSRSSMVSALARWGDSMRRRSPSGSCRGSREGPLVVPAVGVLRSPEPGSAGVPDRRIGYGSGRVLGPPMTETPRFRPVVSPGDRGGGAGPRLAADAERPVGHV